MMLRAALTDATSTVNNTHQNFSNASFNQSRNRAKWDKSTAARLSITHSMKLAVDNEPTSSTSTNSAGPIALRRTRSISTELEQSIVVDSTASSPTNALKKTSPPAAAGKLAEKQAAVRERVIAARTRSSTLQTRSRMSTAVAAQTAAVNQSFTELTLSSPASSRLKRGPPSAKQPEPVNGHKRIKSIEQSIKKASENENNQQIAQITKPSTASSMQPPKSKIVRPRPSMAVARPSTAVVTPLPLASINQSNIPSTPKSARQSMSIRDTKSSANPPTIRPSTSRPSMCSPSPASARRKVERPDLTGIVATLTEEKDSLTKLNALLSNDLMTHQKDILDLTSLNGTLRATLHASNQTNHELQHKIEMLEQQIAVLNDRCHTEELIRRKLHNVIQGLKGPIRVFARLRPQLTGESGALSSTNSLHDDKLLEVQGALEASHTGGANTRRSQTFVFDRVFGSDSSQQQVYEEVSEVVTSCLDGHSVLVLAYGQTSSGKTYTMDGPLNESTTQTLNQSSQSLPTSPARATRSKSHKTTTSYLAPDTHQYEHRGVIQRSLEHMFSEINSRKSKGWTYQCSLCIFEVYNDTIRDLLVANDRAVHEVRSTGVVSNLTRQPVSAVAEAYPLLDLAKTHRSVSSTDSNERSSRSHLIVQLYLTSINQSDCLSTTQTSVLNLIDLAGSERVKASKVEGARLKEAQEINKSLSALSNVISALAREEAHIPFRNSKLTHVLQPHLQGDSKTVLIVNLSPMEDHQSETIASIRFAQSAAGKASAKKK